MRRRVMMGKRELVEVVEELNHPVHGWCQLVVNLLMYSLLVAVALVHRQALKEVVEGRIGVC